MRGKELIDWIKQNNAEDYEIKKPAHSTGIFDTYYNAVPKIVDDSYERWVSDNSRVHVNRKYIVF